MLPEMHLNPRLRHHGFGLLLGFGLASLACSASSGPGSDGDSSQSDDSSAQGSSSQTASTSSAQDSSVEDSTLSETNSDDSVQSSLSNSDTSGSGSSDEVSSSVEDSLSTDSTDSADTSDTSTETTDSTTDTTTDSTTDNTDACAGDQPKVKIETNHGDMEVVLDRVNAPITVENFLVYVQEGAYDGTIYHRIIDNFMIQGGGFLPGMDPIMTHDPIELEVSSALRHVDGAISMARTNDPNSADAQFFICDGAQSFLDDQYAAFGVLTAGEDVLREIASVATDDNDVPNEDVVMTKVSCVSYFN